MKEVETWNENAGNVGSKCGADKKEKEGVFPLAVRSRLLTALCPFSLAPLQHAVTVRPLHPFVRRCCHLYKGQPRTHQVDCYWSLFLFFFFLRYLAA
ncbi:hypothetical protein VNO77_18610 [Canavalia gladiata]|uniref:Uncharacterized protein n=1 Tax=Canavalia gladiata TaxID=3824 RepID=A0AAN9QHU5_CANGL